MQLTLDKYLKALNRLKRGNTPMGIAPHKPVLLISIIELIEKGIITENKVYINADLVGTFKENWQLLINTLHQPIVHRVTSNAGERSPSPLTLNQSQINAHIKSVSTLANTVAYGCFSTELFLLLNNPLSRNVIKQALLDTYFPASQQNLQTSTKGEGYLHQLQDYILNEPEAQYRRIKIETEEDIFVRGGLFKKLIPKAYASTCSFTGMQLTSTYGHHFIDACHIVPFSLTHDDKISNGIALCPNMHRAFDRGLLSIDEHYCLLVSPGVIEDPAHNYSISKLAGKQIHLPPGEKYYPTQENLAWHRENVFKRQNISETLPDVLSFHQATSYIHHVTSNECERSPCFLALSHLFV